MTSSIANPFDDWPFLAVEENLHNQIQQLREHPMYGKDFGVDFAAFSPNQQQQMVELFLREEAIRFMQDRIRMSRQPLPDKVNLPLRRMPAPWLGILALWYKKLEKWRKHAHAPEGTDAGIATVLRPMPDCVEILLQDFLKKVWNQRKTPEQKCKGKHAIRKSTYSKVDAELFEQLGRGQILRLTDSELWKRNRPTLGSDGYTYASFRARVKRIRHKHNLPFSREVKKMANDLDK